MVKFILANDVGYYLGKNYIYQGGYYPCCSNRRAEGKRYSTEKRAETAAESVKKKTGQKFNVIPLEVEEE